MFRDRLGRVLDRVAGLLVRARLLEDVRCEDIAHVVWPMRKQTLDSASFGIGIVDAVALDDQPPGFIERVLVVLSRRAARLDGLHEEGPRVRRAGQKTRAMAINIGFQVAVEIADIRQDQPERLVAENRMNWRS